MRGRSIEMDKGDQKTADVVFFLNYESSNDIYFNEIGAQRCEPSYSYGPIVRPEAIFHFVESGHGTLYLNNVEHKIGPKQGFLIPNNVLAYYIADEDDPWSYYWFHLGGPMEHELFAKAGIDAAHPVFSSIADTAPLESIIKDMLAHYQHEYYCLGKVYEFFDFIIRNSVNTPINVADSKLVYVRKVINYIRLYFCEQITVESISAAMGLNRSYLTRVFKEATGQSIQEYLCSYRMNVASRMLQETTQSIQYISYAVGYSDAFTFSKAFKRYSHTSPSEFREEAMAKARLTDTIIEKGKS